MVEEPARKDCKETSNLGELCTVHMVEGNLLEIPYVKKDRKYVIAFIFLFVLMLLMCVDFNSCRDCL